MQLKIVHEGEYGVWACGESVHAFVHEGEYGVWACGEGVHAFVHLYMRGMRGST